MQKSPLLFSADYALVLFADTLSCGLAVFLLRMEHVEGVQVPVEDVHVCIDSRCLEIIHVGEGLTVEWLAIGHECIAGREVRIVRLPGRGGVFADGIRAVLLAEVLLPGPVVPPGIPARCSSWRA